MSDNKKYYWMKMGDQFFSKPHIKLLYKTTKGQKMILMYFKLLFYSIHTDGMLYYTHLESSFVQEIALILDEKPKEIEGLLAFLLKNRLMEQIEEDSYLLCEAAENLGSESDSAKRVRKHRARKTLQCNNDVTPMKQIVTQSKSNSRAELQIDLERDLEREPEPEPEPAPAQSTIFYPPTLLEVQEFCADKAVDSERFYHYYQANGWKTNAGLPIVNWQALVKNWVKTEHPKPAPPNNNQSSFDIDLLDRLMDIVPSIHD